MDSPQDGSRRAFLRRGAIVGGAAWAVPMIITVDASAQTALSPPPSTSSSATTTPGTPGTFGETTTTTTSTTTPPGGGGGGETTTTTEGTGVGGFTTEPDIAVGAGGIEPQGGQGGVGAPLARTGTDPTALVVLGAGLTAAGAVVRVWSARERDEDEDFGDAPA